MNFDDMSHKARNIRPAAMKHAVNVALWAVIVHGSAIDSAVRRGARLHGVSAAELKRKLNKLGVA